ncbi:MAG TPA: polyprenyl synthetase family protein, partial [Candidatus Saccharimonadales bacterium]|nr:polyprenyl synthetase family protein [Candidatus Saccharimonadales bacterium]
TTLFAEPFVTEDPLRAEGIRFIAEGGKRFRPALSLVTARSLGQGDVFPHLALETFHKYLLAHDDIIDLDDLRYGAPTIHAKMAETHQGGGDATHFGRSLALIAGDLMANTSTKIVIDADLPTDIKLSLLQCVAKALDEVAWGWYDQFLMDYLPLDSRQLSFARIENSIIWVTGKYSIKLPLVYGFTVAGRPMPKHLEEFADVLGALFQTGDDLMGLFGKIEDTGKSNFGDITQGKKTLPIWLTYTEATSKEKQRLSLLVGKKDITANEVDEVRSIIKRSGGLRKTKALMSQYRDQSLAMLRKISLPEDLKKFLQGFIYFLETRDR